MNSKECIKCIDEITRCLIKIGLSNEQNFPSLNKHDIYISGDFDHGISLRNIDYKEIYETLVNQKNFNFKLIDGALIQIMYSFSGDAIIKHRLCYFPSPHLLAYNDNFEIYELDEIYGDMVMKNILPIPIRFDYEVDPKKYIDVLHPYSHLTLGQHKACRIPIKSPLDPFTFISFIIRNFYSMFNSNFIENYKGKKHQLNSITISNNEKKILHFNLEY